MGGIGKRGDRKIPHMNDAFTCPKHGPNGRGPEGRGRCRCPLTVRRQRDNDSAKRRVERAHVRGIKE